MLFIILFTVTALHSIGQLKTVTISTGQFFSHVVYVQEILKVPAMDVAFWTLCIEIQFYLVFASVAYLMDRASLTSRW